MKNRIIAMAVGIILVLFSSLHAQITFERWYPFTASGCAYSVAQTMDGGYVIVGKSTLQSPNSYLLLMKTDSIGDTLWVRTYDEAIGFSVRQTSDSSFIIAGICNDSSGYGDVLLLKTNNEGTEMWQRSFGSNTTDCGNDVIETSDNCYIITGSYSGYDPDYDLWLIKTDLNGDTLWTRIKGGNGGDWGYSVQETNDGGYIIAGGTHSFGGGGVNFYLVKTDSMGSTIWQKLYGGSGAEQAKRVIQTNDGGYVLAGFTNSFGAGGLDQYMVKTDSYGDTLWTKTYGGIDDDWANSVVVKNGNHILSGYTESYGIGGLDLYLVKADSNGTFLWQKMFGGNNNEEGYDIQNTDDGGFIIVGEKESCVYMVKTDSLGNVGIQEDDKQENHVNVPRISCYPNPFFLTLTIKSDSKTQIYDISGKFITEVQNEWNGRDSQGHPVPPGIYFLKLNGKPIGKVVKVR